MLLALLPLDFLIEGKCLIVVTYMISVCIGHESTRQLRRFWNTWMMPATPVPMFFISPYALLLNCIVEHVISVCLTECKSIASKFFSAGRHLLLVCTSLHQTFVRRIEFILFSKCK